MTNGPATGTTFVRYFVDEAGGPTLFNSPKARGLPALHRRRHCSAGKPGAHDRFAATHGLLDAYLPPTANADIFKQKPLDRAAFEVKKGPGI